MGQTVQERQIKVLAKCDAAIRLAIQLKRPKVKAPFRLAMGPYECFPKDILHVFIKPVGGKLEHLGRVYTSKRFRPIA